MTHEMIAALLAQAGVSPVSILFGMNASLSAAIVALYVDCRSDRRRLWDHVRDLEKRIKK